MGKFGNAGALRQELNGRLIFIGIFSCMGAFTFGFDNGWWGGVLGNVYFNEVFGTAGKVVDGVTTYSLSTSQISAGTTLGTALIGIGCMVAGYITDAIGRKKSFYVTAIGSAIGVIIQVTSGINGGRYWQLVVGKMVVCFAIGIAAVSVPLYLAETAPAAIRGAMVNTYVWVQTIGSMVSSGVLYSVLNYTDHRVWIIPISLQLLAPVITLSVAHLLPESPRWLVEKGRVDEARAALISLRKGTEGYNPDDDLRELEIAHETKLNRPKVSWIECFRGKNLVRTSICAGVQMWQQGQGLSFMANYLIIFLIQLGIPNPYKILLILTGCLSILTLAGFFVQDYFGRRFLLVIGGSVMGAALLAVAGITTANPAPTGAMANACVALIALWLVAFTQSWTNIPWTVSAELPAEELRDKTLAIGAFGGFITGMIVGLVNPYMQDPAYGNLGGKVGFVYGAMSVCAVVWCHYMVPELKGRSLEEIDWMFDNNVPLRKMGTYVVDRDHLPTLARMDTGAKGSASSFQEEKAATADIEHLEK